MDHQTQQEDRQLQDQRWELLTQISEALDWPLIGLSFVWLALMIAEFTVGLTRGWQIVSSVIWVIFIVGFILEFAIAPDKLRYLRHNWLTALSLLLPAFRILRAFRALRLLRAARAARSLSLLRLVTTLNRGMRATRSVLGQRGAGYVTALTAIAVFGGAAGVFQFEGQAALGQAGLSPADAARGFQSYPEALWWASMLMTSLGSDYWPQTADGRALTVVLALYAVGVFGYVTATIASYFVGKDLDPSSFKGAEIDRLTAEVRGLREALQSAQER